MKTEKEAYEDLEKIVGHLRFPLSMTYDRFGNVKSIEFQKTWKEGTTVATGKFDDQGQEIFRNDYTDHSLTEKQIADIENYVSSLNL